MATRSARARVSSKRAPTTTPPTPPPLPTTTTQAPNPPRLPPGARDHLPRAAARRRGLVAQLVGEIERWGYQAVITPIVEYDEVLRRGLGGAARALRLVEPSTGEVLALRSDLTAQVARLVATRLRDEPGPLRLSYQGSVMRLPDAAGGALRGEIFQVGVELIDAPTEGGDLEAILLAEAVLGAAGLPAVSRITVDLGHAEFVRAALDGLPLSVEQREALHAALQKRDPARVAALAGGMSLPPGRRMVLEALPTLHGGPETIARARAVLGSAARAPEERRLRGGPAPRSRRRTPAGPLVAVQAPVAPLDFAAAGRALDELGLLVERLGRLGPLERLTLDLGDVRGFDYYTGTRFALYADGVPGAVVSGGRYDRLVERFGRPARATGFAVDVDRVADVLRERGVPAPQPTGGVLVAGEAVAAARLASLLRARGVRAVLDLDGGGDDLDAARLARARRAGLRRVVAIRRDRLAWKDVPIAGVVSDAGAVTGAALKRLVEGSDPAALDALASTG
jgi:ATP phosphoribosyltransferase regulatory subunit